MAEERPGIYMNMKMRKTEQKCIKIKKPKNEMKKLRRWRKTKRIYDGSITKSHLIQ